MARQNQKKTTAKNPILARLTRTRRGRAEYEAELLSLEVSELLAKIMKRKSVAPIELAWLMRARTTFVKHSLLGHTSKVQLSSIALAFAALGFRLKLTAELITTSD